MKTVGWILDTYIEDDEAILWIKTVEGKAVKLRDLYQPDFYVKFKDDVNAEEAATLIMSHPNIVDARVEWRYPSVVSREKSGVVHVSVDKASGFKRVLRDLERVNGVEEWFNTDILHVQRYLFSKAFAPTNKVEVEYDHDGKIKEVTVLDDGVEFQPPPFTSLIFQIEAQSERLTPDPEEDPIAEITVFNEALDATSSLTGDEPRIIQSLADIVQKSNPDFLVAPDCDEVTLPYLMKRVQKLCLNVQLGREPAAHQGMREPYHRALQGRVTLQLGDFLHDGVAGIVEESRFTIAPPGLASRWRAGRAIDSRQCYEALRKNILIPKLRNYPRFRVTAKDLIFRDRGGLILSPAMGLHENVAELDYESMFPNILIAYNISYETVTPKGIDKSRPGFLGEFTKRFLDRRLHFKRLRRKYPRDSREWLWCEQRQSALKQILVCIYGFSGCDVNRFGSVYTYSEINNVSRNILVKTLNIALREGFKVVYADCDSIFVKKPNATRSEYEGLAAKIQGEVGLPIALDHHYKFLVLLAQEADPNIESVRHYFGKLVNSELYYRGIELRRRDYPEFLKDFQTRLMEILFKAEDAEQVRELQYLRAREYVVECLGKIADGEVPAEKLVVRKMLRKPIDGYRSMFPHVSAAIQMVQKGKKFNELNMLRDSHPIDFLLVNAEHPNPLRRVMPAQLINSNHHYYDHVKYQEMLLDVAETILGWNGFTREQLGYKSPARGFQKEIRDER